MISVTSPAMWYNNNIRNHLINNVHKQGKQMTSPEQHKFIASYYQLIFSNKVAAPNTDLFNAIMNYLLGYTELHEDRNNTFNGNYITREQNLEFLKVRLTQLERDYDESTTVDEFKSTCYDYDDFETLGNIVYA